MHRVIGFRALREIRKVRTPLSGESRSEAIAANGRLPTPDRMGTGQCHRDHTADRRDKNAKRF